MSKTEDHTNLILQIFNFGFGCNLQALCNLVPFFFFLVHFFFLGADSITPLNVLSNFLQRALNPWDSGTVPLNSNTTLCLRSPRAVPKHSRRMVNRSEGRTGVSGPGVTSHRQKNDEERKMTPLVSDFAQTIIPPSIQTLYRGK